MLVRERPDGAIETRHRPVALPLLLALCGLAALSLALSTLAAGHAAVGALLAVLAALCLRGAWVQRLPSRFLFDPLRRVVHWRCPAAFLVRAGEGSGEYRFQDVRQVVLQPGPGKRSDRVRLALMLAGGARPMARDFDLDIDEASAIAERLRAVLGLPGAREVIERVLDTARAEGDEAAIAALRERDGLSLEQATELLQHLKER